ncbi:TRAP transporter large permease subunit [Acuticoccus sp. M5D2P5]|uniref:TRAP transporter large permease subunit n=1 Tax=Acuticoccus kalidii TaxID=2910977 RepID=UPI001F396CD8|nr:TRAP transporter large permease subunit [Acuticoccus kalidii]MCF3935610.1 TRAP transporter large permease subunit [Acuticoccus kalidii]
MADRLRFLSHLTASLLLGIIVLALTTNVVARTFALPIVGASLVAQWALPALAFASLATLATSAPGRRRWPGQVILGFVFATLLAGLLSAGERVGGVEAVLGIPTAWRYHVAAALTALGFAVALLRGGPWLALAGLAGAALVLLPLPQLPLWVALAVFALALAFEVPVALALVAGAALAPGPLSDAAMAQSVMRGLSPYVLLAIPLFVFAAALMVAGGIGARMVVAARWIAQRRASALGEANVVTSLLFGGVSGSSIADAALGARLLVPGMVAAGYRPGRAAAITAASSVLPNVLPPSIALLLAAAATDQSVGALWLAGVGAGLTLTAALWIAVRLTPPQPAAETVEAEPVRGRDALLGVLPPVAIAIVVLGGLRLGIVTAVEAGLLAVFIAAAFAAAFRGLGAFLAAISEAAVQTGRVAFLIGAATPIGFLFATSGLKAAAFLPAGPALLVLLAAAGLCILIGTVLDVGAAILLMLPVLLPAAVAAGFDPIHATLVLTTALLLGGLTPPVGVLVLVVKDITKARGVYRALIPYFAALVLAVGVLLLVPALTVGLVKTL